MKNRIAFLLTLVLSPLFASSAEAITDLYLAVDDGGETFPDGRLFHYTYNSSTSPPTYSLFGQSPLGAGTTINSLAVNSSPGSGGGIYAAMSGNFNQLVEYSFNRASGVFTSERAISGIFSEVAVDGLDRIYAVETATTGLLHNYVTAGGTFNSNASIGATDAGGSAQLAILLNNNVAVSGETSGGAPSMSQQYSLSGSSFNLTGANHNGALIPSDLATSPLDGKIWLANKNVPLGSGFNTLYELRVPLADGPNFGFENYGQTIIFDDIDILSDGTVVAVGVSDFFTGADETFLVSINPNNAAANGLIQVSVGGPSPTVLTIDHEDTIHVSTMGQLTAWKLGPHPEAPGFKAFSAVAQIHGVGDLGVGTAIVTAVDPSVVNIFGDYNADGKVDAADYVAWRNNLGNPDESTINNNGDGANGVDAGDYTLWRANFGNPGNAGLGSTQIPEPSSLALLMFAATTLVLRQRRS
ncbi:MAG: PEP-CTERM sorting domain-containing protein [Planctomycetota bacterium]|nr:PEP-CTERM sorting domain-containing protein [Planctomycetota bacterium]